MILSMTGFTTKTISFVDQENNKVYLTVTLKSLNSRFFEATCKIPYALNSIETELIKLFKLHLYRGHITFSLHVSNPSLFKGPIEPALPIIKSYLNAIVLIQEECRIAGNITIAEIMQLPNVFSMEEKSIDESIKSTVLNAINSLIIDLIETRKAEGQTLKIDLLARYAIIDTEIRAIEQAAEELMKLRKQTLNKSLQDLEQENTDLTEIKKNLIYHEINKIDIHEEIIRFKSHLHNLILQINSADPEKGRRLDFIVQELGREINTIAAKCSDVAISTIAINIKVELEKIREQVQNIV